MHHVYVCVKVFDGALDGNGANDTDRFIFSSNGIISEWLLCAMDDFIERLAVGYGEQD